MWTVDATPALGLACDTAGTPSRLRLTPTALSALEEDPALFAEHVHPLASADAAGDRRPEDAEASRDRPGW
jgi:hypothetical protein